MTCLRAVGLRGSAPTAKRLARRRRRSGQQPHPCPRPRAKEPILLSLPGSLLSQPDAAASAAVWLRESRAARGRGEQRDHGGGSDTQCTQPVAAQPPTGHLPGPATPGRLERRCAATLLYSLIPLNAVITPETVRKRGGDENEGTHAKHVAQCLAGDERTPPAGRGASDGRLPPPYGILGF